MLTTFVVTDNTSLPYSAVLGRQFLEVESLVLCLISAAFTIFYEFSFHLVKSPSVQPSSMVGSLEACFPKICLKWVDFSFGGVSY